MMEILKVVQQNDVQISGAQIQGMILKQNANRQTEFIQQLKDTLGEMSHSFDNDVK